MSVSSSVLLAILSAASVGVNVQPVSHLSCENPVAVYNKMLPAVVKIKWESSRFVVTGSGLVTDSSGEVVTSTHVVSGSMKNKIEVIDSYGKSYTYERDKTGDGMSVSSLKPVNEHPTDFISLEDISVVPGEQVITAGYPMNYNESFNTGYVMSMFKYQNLDFITSTMSVSPGMSGSAVVNCAGKPVGFIYAYDTRAGVISIMNPVKDALSLGE